MKSRALLLSILVLLAFAGVSQAGCWRGGGGWGWGGGWCGPRVGWGWGGWRGPSFAIAVAAPVPVYRTVYYPAYPAPAYATYTVARTTSTLAQAQARLANLGYYRGAVDGAFGPLTSRAITIYQSDYRLPVTGRLDPATRRSLGV
jgi:hypothetical protein